MGKLRTSLCLLLLGALIPAAIVARAHLPVDVQPLIEAKYGGWAGALRLWVCEGWPPGSGSAAGWLNRCIASFEKRHPGVYVQPEVVDAGAVRDLGSDGILPPDLVLFPPGVLETGDMLLPVAGDDRATPVLRGGYLWVYNPERLPGIPADWREAAIPPDEPFRRWGAAVLALSTGQAEEAETPPAGEIDLGLETFSPVADAWRDFVNGEAPAMPVTQREVRRLQALDDQGRGPSWRLAGWAGPMFTDQVLYLGLVDRGDPGREALCRAFADHLRSDDCQGQLCRAGAFAVTGVSSGYSAGDPLAIMDAALRAGEVGMAPPFGTAWQQAVDGIVREFIKNNADPTALWPRIQAALGQISEH